MQRRGPRSGVDIEPQLDQERDRLTAVLLGRADQLVRASLDRALAQAGIGRQQPLNGAAVTGHRGRDQLVDLIVLPGRTRVDQQRHDVHVTVERRLLYWRASLIDGVLWLAALGVDTHGRAGRGHGRRVRDRPRRSAGPRASSGVSLAARRAVVARARRRRCPARTRREARATPLAGLGPSRGCRAPAHRSRQRRPPAAGARARVPPGAWELCRHRPARRSGR